MPGKDVLSVNVNLTIEGQPQCCAKLREAGWRFDYDTETRFVSASHPLGGKQSVVEIHRICRTKFDTDEIGQQIAMLLNGGNINSVLSDEVTA